MQIVWEKQDASFVATVGNIKLAAVPNLYHRFKPKAARGAKWRAMCSSWNEATKTLSRYGRDEYDILYDSYSEAMRAAEAIFNEEWNKRRRCPHGELLSNHCNDCVKENSFATC